MVESKVQGKIGSQLMSGKRWDKLRSWKALRNDIEEKLKDPEKFDTGITLEIGPQLLHTLRHRSSLRCMNHSVSKLGEVFTTHYNMGAIQRISVWVMGSKSKDSVCEQLMFDTQHEINCITYVTKRRVYAAFCNDLYLRLFTDANTSCVDICEVPFTATVLCLVYNREDDEIYAGGVGFIEEWKITGAEHAASLVPGRKFLTTDISRNDWIRDIKLDRVNNQLFAMHGNGIIVFHLKTRRQTHRLPNRHDGPLKCCCYFPQFDNLITGGADGKIRIFNATAFNPIHVLIGHKGPVTTVEPHRKETLLFSCSHDGTVRLWRMDSLKIFTRLEIGEKIYHLSLLGDTEFFFRTEKDLMIYTQNQFYQFFSSVESKPYKLICCRAKGKPNRLLVSTEDGSVRVFSPVTGLTLTIIYPMPTFQIFTQFAYDLHQNRLHTVLQGGKVIVYNTATNPCKCEELWEPSSHDEYVTKILIVTVDFQCEGVWDVDNLVFAGLNNGQIILCESLVCVLKFPVQAHEGALTCFEANRQERGATLFSSSHVTNVVVTGGEDCFFKIWLININSETSRPLVELSLLLKIYLQHVPLHICMAQQLLAVVVKTSTHLGTRWRLVMYNITICRRHIPNLSTAEMWRSSSGSWIIPVQMNHSPNEDHSQELTAIDKCTAIKIFLTAGKDGFIKIWSNDNQLLREMNFAEPIYASCFANDRGDVLVGYGTHVCSVSVINYLPLENLAKLRQSSALNIKDDEREFPVNFDHKAEPWLDLENIKKYPIHIFERRRQKIEEEVIEKLKKAASEKEAAAAKFVIFVDGGTTQVIRKDFADRLLHWAKGKNKVKLGLKTATPPSIYTDVDTSKGEIDTKLRTASKPKELGIREDFRASDEKDKDKIEPKYLDSEKQIEIYPSTVGQALRDLELQKSLGPTEIMLLKEKKLLDRHPIIAPDGYIPNSVIRKKLGLKPKKPAPPTLRRQTRWKVKSLPKPDPKHMPEAWDIPQTDIGKHVSKREVSASIPVFDWPASPKPSSDVETEPSPEAESPVGRGRDAAVREAGYQMKSKRIEMLRMDDPRTRRPKVARKLPEMGGKEEPEETTKERKKRKAIMEVELVRKLIEERWMPKVDSSSDEYEDILTKLFTKLDDHNPMVYSDVTDYLNALFIELGIKDELLDDLIAKLGANLKSLNTSIKRHTLKGLQVVGAGRLDAIQLVLSTLIDDDAAVRKAAAEAILILTGAKDKETLMQLLDSYGITGGIYNSREDELFAFRVLKERLADIDDLELCERIQGRIEQWVRRTVPGMISDGMSPEDLEQMWKEDPEFRNMCQYKSKEKLREDSAVGNRRDSRRESRRESTRESKLESRRYSRRESRRDSRQEYRRESRHKESMDSRRSDDRSSVTSGRRSRRSSGAGFYRLYGRERKSVSGYAEGGDDDKDYKTVSGYAEEGDDGKDYKTMSIDGSSQMSGQDSGICPDMSELSQRGKGYPYGTCLSPVKSEGSAASDEEKERRKPQWRKLFELPSAIERRQMAEIKREKAEGKLKRRAFPPISYFGRDLPMLPGEAGTRLLETIKVGEKAPAYGDGRHRIKAVPGKLSVHTQNESKGTSQFGIMQMDWTTWVPTKKTRRSRGKNLHGETTNYSSGHRLRSENTGQSLPPLQTRISQSDRLRQGTSDTEIRLPSVVPPTTTPVLSRGRSPKFQWELPLPPPPAKESRTNVPEIKKEHDTYCKYYHLVKKKLRLMSSKQRERCCIPNRDRKSAPENHQRNEVQMEQRQKTDNRLLGRNDNRLLGRNDNRLLGRNDNRLLGRNDNQLLGRDYLLPPIKLGQLINF